MFSVTFRYRSFSSGVVLGVVLGAVIVVVLLLCLNLG